MVASSAERTGLLPSTVTNNPDVIGLNLISTPFVFVLSSDTSWYNPSTEATGFFGFSPVFIS